MGNILSKINSSDVINPFSKNNEKNAAKVINSDAIMQSNIINETETASKLLKTVADGQVIKSAINAGLSNPDIPVVKEYGIHENSECKEDDTIFIDSRDDNNLYHIIADNSTEIWRYDPLKSHGDTHVDDDVFVKCCVEYLREFNTDDQERIIRTIQQELDIDKE